MTASTCSQTSVDLRTRPHRAVAGAHALCQATALVSVEREGIVTQSRRALSRARPDDRTAHPARGRRRRCADLELGTQRLRQRAGAARPAAARALVLEPVHLGLAPPDRVVAGLPPRGTKDYRGAYRYRRSGAALASSSVRTQLPHGPAAHRLDVKVEPTSAASTACAKPCARTVRVAQGGQPAAGAEIAFAAVDEGTARAAGQRVLGPAGRADAAAPWGVATATAQGEIIGRRHYGRKALPPGGGGGRNPTRELFDTLLLWRDTVTLDANGEARDRRAAERFAHQLPLVAIADAVPGRFGTGSTSVRVSQDLQMLSGLPPLAREGDRFDAGFTLRNTTAAGDEPEGHAQRPARRWAATTSRWTCRHRRWRWPPVRRRKSAGLCRCRPARCASRGPRRWPKPAVG
jgi:hypothetical protein